MMKGRSYLSVGGTSMGIAGSIVNHDFFQKFLGMRVESVDMMEVLRRIERGVVDGEETELALAWVQKNCRDGVDINPPKRQHSAERKAQERKICVQMTQIIRDLMVGNPRLAELGFGEEALGHDAIAGGFQGQRHWTDHLPNGDFAEAMLNTSFDWNGPRSPYVVATENDSLNAVPMLFGRLLTNTAQIFADVRTYWSPTAVKRVTGHKLAGEAKNGIIHLINSGPAALDGIGAMKRKGKPAFKHHWEITEADISATMKEVSWCPAVDEYFRGGGFSTSYKTLGGIPVTMTRLSLVDGLGPILQVIEGWTVELPAKVHQTLDGRTNPTWPTTWFRPAPHRHRPDQHGLWHHGRLERQPLRADLRPRRRRLRLAGQPAAHPAGDAQPGRRRPLPPGLVGPVRRRRRAGRRLSRLRRLRGSLLARGFAPPSPMA